MCIRDSNTVALDVDMWPLWDMLKMPILAVRGASSDLLLPETLSLIHI